MCPNLHISLLISLISLFLIKDQINFTFQFPGLKSHFHKRGIKIISEYNKKWIHSVSLTLMLKKNKDYTFKIYM